ncbi:MAG: acyltransferase family protein [Candidatus Ornithomonoglobus sp.]
MEKILKYRSNIYGLCAIWIMLFHICHYAGIPGNPLIIAPLIRMGNIGVDIFMFLSGYCLSLSFRRNDNVKQFFIKRFKRVLISYVIVSIPFYLWKSIIEIPSAEFINLTNFLTDITGYSFWKNGVQNTWFVHAIIVFYILFPLLYKVISKGKVYAAAVVVLAYIFNIAAFYCVPLYRMSSIAWTRLPIFIIGIAMAYYKSELKMNKRIYTAFAIYLIVAVGIFPVRDLYVKHAGDNYTYLWLFYSTLVVPLLYAMAFMIKKLPETINKCLCSVGGISLELYMIHIILLHILKYYIRIDKIGLMLYIIIPTISIPISYAVKKLSNLIYIGNKMKK